MCTYSILSLALVRVKCCQTGKLHKASVANLGRADELPLCKEDLMKGANLLWDYGNHSYSVKVVEVLSSGEFSLSGFDSFTHTTLRMEIIIHIHGHICTCDGYFCAQVKKTRMRNLHVQIRLRRKRNLLYMQGRLSLR